METQRTVNLFMDIETYSSDNKPTIEDISAPANYKDADKILAYKQEHLDSAWRKQALDSMLGQIICISYAINDEEVVALTGTEKEIIAAFADVVCAYPYAQFVGFNHKRFDLVWLFHRFVKYKHSEAMVILPHTKNDSSIIDVMEIFSASNYGSDSWVSLDTLAKFLGLPCKDFDGSKIHDLYLEGKIDEIVKHCEDDVRLTRDIYKLTQ